MLSIPIGERAAVPLPPPPETDWYHGRLDRYSAEQRLKAAYKLGSYLGKEKNGNFRCKYLFLSHFYLFPLIERTQWERAIESQEAMYLAIWERQESIISGKY